MIVGEHSCAFIVGEPASCVVGDIEDLSFSWIPSKILKDSSEVGLSKAVSMAYVVSEDLSVEGIGEPGVPSFDELWVGVRKLAYELIVSVDPVVDAVVAYQRLPGFDHSLYN